MMVKMEHVLMLAIVLLILYHFIGRCGCANGVVNGFSVGAEATGLPTLRQRADLTKMMKNVEELWLQGSCGADRDKLNPFISEKFQGTWIDGSRYDKEQALSTDDNTNCELGEVDIKFFGENIAIAYGSESSYDENNNKVCLVWTDTWLKSNEEDGWQIIAAQDAIELCK